MTRIFQLICFAFAFSMMLALPSEISNSEVDAKIAECEKKCIVTFDFQPRCGSDGITYNNRRLLECRDKCGEPYGRRVHKVSDGACPTKN